VADLALRPELAALLSKHTSLDTEELITLDDLSAEGFTLEKVLGPDRTRWVLVDHNVMTGRLAEHFSDRVVGVVDHHVDEGKVPTDCGKEPRIIETSGSCASLVVNLLNEGWKGLEVTDCDKYLAKIALASILIDTTNMTVESKVTSHDKAALDCLKSRLPASFNTSDFFTEISDAKEDIGPLKLNDILRKDYKEWRSTSMKLGVGSVVKPLGFLVEKADSECQVGSVKEPFLNAVKDFAAARDLDVVALMTTYTPEGGDFERELLVWGLNDRAAGAVSRFQEQAGGELGLKPLRDSSIRFGDSKVKVWQQTAVEHSRKRVAPLLRDAMSTDGRL
jgi:exopolyphosphatase